MLEEVNRGQRRRERIKATRSYAEDPRYCFCGFKAFPCGIGGILGAVVYPMKGVTVSIWSRLG